MVSLVADQPQPTDWPAALAALSGLDGPEWDTESARLDALWTAKYVEAFVAYAVSREWTSENAKTWAAAIAVEALIDNGRANPSPVARRDVLECEREARNAC